MPPTDRSIGRSIFRTLHWLIARLYDIVESPGMFHKSLQCAAFVNTPRQQKKGERYTVQTDDPILSFHVSNHLSIQEKFLVELHYRTSVIFS